jgi:hypothetical protein
VLTTSASTITIVLYRQVRVGKVGRAHYGIGAIGTVAPTREKKGLLNEQRILLLKGFYNGAMTTKKKFKLYEGDS